MVTTIWPWTNFNSNCVSILKKTVTGLFKPVNFAAGSGRFSLVFASDLDGDGDNDLGRGRRKSLRIQF